MSPDGICYVWVYGYNGEVIAVTSFHTFSEASCASKAEEFAAVYQ